MKQMSNMYWKESDSHFPRGYTFPGNLCVTLPTPFHRLWQLQSAQDSSNPGFDLLENLHFFFFLVPFIAYMYFKKMGRKIKPDEIYR